MGAMPENRTLKSGGQKSAAKVFQTTRRNKAPIQDDETRKILVFAPQPVTNPGAHARSTREAQTCVKKIIGIGMLREIGSHRTDNAQLIGMSSKMWEKFANGDATVAVLFEGPGAGQRVTVVIELRGLHAHFEGLPMLFLQTRFRIKGIH